MEELFGTKKLGFGCMRLPLTGPAADPASQVDYEKTCRMVDDFLAAGFCYFDTAHGYLNGKSETALRHCLTSRYPRQSYLLANKLSNSFFECEEEIRPLFFSQLEACGVAYFDFYLMHAMNAEYYPKYCACNAFAVARQLKAEGRIRHIGISFHDKPALLEQILSEQPDIEVVQIQFNYADYEDPGVQSRAVYEVCREFHKPVIVMEPVKGGRLANLPPQAAQVLENLQGGSAASYAVRFAASYESVGMVLSGMSTTEQMEDNLSYMQAFAPLNGAEKAAVSQVCSLLQAQNLIACTNCRYCVAGCPKEILIPDLFACLNAKKQYKDWNSDFYYEVNTTGHGKASDCIKCGQCEHVCPQHLPIRKLLTKAAAVFEKANS